ncbi:hypothetical protein ACEWY4_005157 [Coilia grayii]|uniref:Coiled-coil domain-containing protein 9B n=1 Tax=Coilia grayii TaxID=363190 RepID=A0ABD1KHL0_9TELE
MPISIPKFILQKHGPQAASPGAAEARAPGSLSGSCRSTGPWQPLRELQKHGPQAASPGASEARAPGSLSGSFRSTGPWQPLRELQKHGPQAASPGAAEARAPGSLSGGLITASPFQPPTGALSTAFEDTVVLFTSMSPVLQTAPVGPDLMKQRDEELDKKIEALRRKNEALMKRYQEVEEDKKKAEQEGMALQSRKSEDLSITINKTTSQEPRVVTKRPGSGGSTPQDKSPRGGGGGGGGGEAADGGPNHFGMGRGKRRQLFVTMVGNNKGTRVVSESAEPPPQRPGGRKSSAEEEEEERSEPSRRGKHAQPRKRSSQTQEDGGRPEGKAAGEDGYWLSECDPYYQDAVWPEPQPQADLTIPTSREEQQEYLRWKAEREQIDRERVARHKNAKGQWRRAWDLDKPQLVFSDKPPGESERQHSTRAGRGSRRGHSKSAGEPQGPQGRGRERKGKNAPAVVGSKAKGKDRLTGRARRWDVKDTDEDKQASETSLEEFLEELDALCDPDNPSTESEVSQNSDGTAPGAADSGNETVTISHEANQANDAASAGASPAGDIDAEGQESVQNAPSPKGPEKKVRFSSELVQGARIQKNPRAVTVENKGSLLKAASAQVKTDAGAGAEPKHTTEQQPPPPPQQQQQQQQQEDAGREHQEEQDTHDVRPTGTEGCGSAASPQHAQEEKAEGKTEEDVKVTDDEQKETELEKEKAKQPEGEAQKPPLSTASETTEAVERASTTIETETGAPTQPDQCPASQQAATIQAANTLAQNTHTTNTQSPAQQAPNAESLNTQSVDTQAPNTESPTTQATTTEATSTQKPAHQGPEHTKTSTSRATEELIDSSLSVLSLDTGDTHPDHVTSTEKAREDGKVV